MTGQELFERFARNAVQQGVRKHSPDDHVVRHRDAAHPPQWWQLSEEIKRVWELTAAAISPKIHGDFEVLQVKARQEEARRYDPFSPHPK